MAHGCGPGAECAAAGCAAPCGLRLRHGELAGVRLDWARHKQAQHPHPLPSLSTQYYLHCGFVMRNNVTLSGASTNRGVYSVYTVFMRIPDAVVTRLQNAGSARLMLAKL